MFEAYYLAQRMPRLSLGLPPEMLEAVSRTMPILSLMGRLPPSMRLPPPSPLMQLAKAMADAQKHRDELSLELQRGMRPLPPRRPAHGRPVLVYSAD